jgi:hypothetical protein
MTVRKYSSTSQETTLTSALGSGASTMVVGSSTALLSGITLSAGDTFTVVIDPDTALEEIVDVIAPSSTGSLTLTIARTIDGSAAIAHSAGAKVRHMAIGRDFREADTHFNATLTAHAATTSAQLASVISDETGTGALVFANSPALLTPTIDGVSFQEKVEDVVGAMVTGNTESGIAITYDDSTGKYNFDVNDPTITIAGDVSGSATMTNLGNTTITVAIPADTIVDADINSAAAIAKTKISGTAITAADTGTVTGTIIADSAVTSAKIADLTIATGDIADSAITSAKIADGTIVAGDLADGAVTSAKILDGTIVNADINAAAAIDKTKISGTAVTVADTGTVTSTMILDGTIVDADINASAAIAYSKLALTGSITSSDIVNGTIVDADVSGTAAIAYGKLSLGGTITSADLVDGTIVNSDINASAGIALSKLATDPLARANHTGTQTASTVSDFDTQVRTSKVTDLAAPTGSFSMNSQKIVSLGTPTANADAATKLYVDTKVSDLVNSAPGTLDTLGEIATAISAGGTVFDAMVLKAGSTMTGALTLSGAPTVDLHAATKAYVDTVAGSATAAAASASAAATTYDNFDDRYLGSKSSPPSVDNDGNAIIEGALYWNSVDNAMYAWDGAAWGSISSTAAIYRFRYTATAGQTTISGTDDNGLTLSYLAGKEQVYLNGVLLARTSDYTATNGTSITSLAALAVNDIVEIITFTAFDLATAIPNTVIDAKGDLIAGTSADTVGKLTVGSNGQYLQADSSTATGLTWSTVSGYSAPTLGSTSIASGATVTTISGLTDIVLNGAGSIQDEFTLILMGAL